jgi:hypothetical protein
MSQLEILKRLDPTGNPAKIAEVMVQQNAILMNPAYECNRVTLHSIKQRVFLPKSEIRRFNSGVGKGATQVKEVLEPTMKRALYSVVDAEEAELSGNATDMRAREDKAIIESIGQDTAWDLIYGNKAGNMDSIDGLAVRLASKALPNVHTHGGSSNCTSLYIIQPGDMKVHLTYPKGSQAGIQHVNKSPNNAPVTWTDEVDGTKNYEALVSYFRSDFGWAIWDARCIARLGDIDVTDLDGFDEDFLIAILNKMPNRGAGAVIYCNADMFTLFDIRAKDKTNVMYNGTDPWGKPQIMFGSRAPIRLVDQISSDEGTLAA